MATQTRVPTGDLDAMFLRSSGDYNYELVDEYPDINDNDYTYQESTDYYRDIFSFQPFSVPQGHYINGVHLHIRAMPSLDQAESPYVHLYINGSTYSQGGLGLSSEGFTDMTVSWSINPATGAAWTVDQVNGIGTYGLSGFGYGLTMEDTTVFYVSRIYLEVEYTALPVLPADGFFFGQVF